jgi:hypothetical protein
MSYKTRYDHVNRVELPQAWTAAAYLDPALKGKTPEDPEALKMALITLARRVAELEQEWS